MPQIKAFRGWRYNRGKVKNFSKVYAPPYDIISKKEQAALYALSPYNVVRVELGKQGKADTADNNRYTRAARTLAEWKKKKVLIREEKPALYIYVQRYSEDGKPRTRLGFLAAMKLDERFVLRHENTLAKPKKDRFALLEQTQMNLSPIFGLFEDPNGRVQSLLKRALRSRPIADVLLGKVRHRLYVSTEPAVVRAVEAAMRNKPMFIADGHHRFEVACQYKRRRQSDPQGRGREWEYALVYFSDCAHNPFKIFPTHRLIRTGGAVKLRGILEKIGTVESVSGLAAILSRLSQCRRDAKDGRYVFGFYAKAEGFLVLTLNASVAKALGRSPVDGLDVAVLHRKVLEPLFDVKSVESSDRIDFTRDPDEACEKVRRGLFDLAVFLRPTSLEEVLWISRKGLKMPQKSTYFYPKLLTGLVFHGFGADEDRTS